MYKYRKLISFVVVFTMLFSYMASVSAIDLSNNHNQAKEQIVFETKIAQTQEDTELTIDQVKSIQDFSGNPYTVIECSPTGYYIYHNESCDFVEYSMSSNSPYKGKFDNLYYGGPTEYYQKQGDIYQHTILDETIPVSDTASLSQSCSDLAEKLNSHPNMQVKAFMEGDVPLSTFSSQAFAASNDVTKYVTDYTLLSNLRTKTQMGYWDYDLDGDGAKEGFCGYIAANLILYYWQKRYPSRNIVASSYLSGSGTGLSGSGLTHTLWDIGRNLGFGSATLPWQIRDVLNQYCANRGISATSGYWLADIYLQSEIDNNRPAILMGTLKKANSNDYHNHAVTVYGYNKSASTGIVKYIAHYGWEYYSNIYITAYAYGGNTNFKLT